MTLAGIADFGVGKAKGATGEHREMEQEGREMVESRGRYQKAEHGSRKRMGLRTAERGQGRIAEGFRKGKAGMKQRRVGERNRGARERKVAKVQKEGVS
jgi:hypothetical protein